MAMRCRIHGHRWIETARKYFPPLSDEKMGKFHQANYDFIYGFSMAEERCMCGEVRAIKSLGDHVNQVDPTVVELERMMQLGKVE